MTDTPVRQQRQILALERELRKDRTADMPFRGALFAARYTTATAQSFTTGTVTIVNYGTLVYDEGSCVTTGAAWAYTCEAAGIYTVSAAVLLASTTNWALGEAGSFLLYKNGASYSALDRNDWINSSVTGQFKHLSGTDHISLAVGDTISIRLRQDSGANLALHNDANFNYVAIAKVA